MNHILAKLLEPISLNQCLNICMLQTLANSEDLDEMLHISAIHQNLQCLPSQKQS